MHLKEEGIYSKYYGIHIFKHEIFINEKNTTIPFSFVHLRVFFNDVKNFHFFQFMFILNGTIIVILMFFLKFHSKEELNVVIVKVILITTQSIELLRKEGEREIFSYSFMQFLLIFTEDFFLDFKTTYKRKLYFFQKNNCKLLFYAYPLHRSRKLCFQNFWKILLPAGFCCHISS